MQMKLKIVVFMLGLITVNILHADERAGTQSGTIYSVDREQNIVVINDMAYAVLPHVLVHGNTDSIGLQSLRENMPVSFALGNSRDDSSKPPITEIWILDSLPAPGSRN